MADKYDILQMAAQARKNPFLKGYEDYFSDKISVQTTKEKGRCVVATSDLKAGELILATKAISVVFSESSEFTLDPTPLLGMELAKRIEIDDEIGNKVYSLVAGDKFTNPQPTDEVNFARLSAICGHNAFSGESFEAMFPNQKENLPGASVTGLWIEPAYLNHSCIPNCTWFFVGDFLFMVTLCNVAASEELVHSYADVMSTYLERTEYLKLYDFECDCKRCRHFKDNPKLQEAEDKYDTEIARILQTNWQTPEYEIEAILVLMKTIKTELDSTTLQNTAIMFVPLATALWSFFRLKCYEQCVVYGNEAGEIGAKWYGDGHPAVTRVYLPVIKGYIKTSEHEKAKELTERLIDAHIMRFKTNRKHFINSYMNLLTLLEIEHLFFTDEK